MRKHWTMATLAIHAGRHPDTNGALVSPLCQNATFVFDSVEQGEARFGGQESGYIYSRLGNPTVTELETKMALLEGAEAAAAMASGMAAISSALLTVLQTGDHLIASTSLYGCTFSLFTGQFSRLGIDVSFVDFGDACAIEAAIGPRTKAVFLETPANPHLQVIDLSMVATIAKSHDLLTVVDNTFMTPLLQQPLNFGADVVVYSATKYLNGHGDVTAGIVCGTGDFIDAIKHGVLKDMGAVLSPHDAWLIIRGLKTLDVRLTRHCDNAEAIACYLNNHPKVDVVYYPGISSHPGHSLIGTQMKRAGGVIAFELCSGYQATLDFINRLSLFSIAVSLGDAESLVQHPASMTHSAYTVEARKVANIGDNLIRVAIGLESAGDLIEALDEALGAI